MSQSFPVHVIGAGMVGVCCALSLQRAGRDVVLVDRRGPGEEASFGNLACFGIASCVPPGMPGILRKVPGMLLNPEAPLKLRWRYAPATLPWFLRYAFHTRPERVEAIAAARQSLLNHVHDILDPLVADAGAGHLMNKGGFLFTFESEEAYRGVAYAFDVRRRNGVDLDDLTGDEARQYEPALSKTVCRAVRVPTLTHTVNPGGLVKAPAASFERQGGRFLHAEVTGFDIRDETVVALRTATGPVPTGGVVVAAGVWSRDLARMLGTRVPLTAERGYHAMYEGSAVKVNSAILSVDRYVSVTPMDYGIRVGGTAEFAPHDAAPNPANAAMIRKLGERLVPGLAEDPGDWVSEWVGSRPSFPDSKPMIGPAPGHANAWFAFGHDHLGLTMGSITGKLVSELVAGRPTTVDLTPFRPDGF